MPRQMRRAPQLGLRQSEVPRAVHLGLFGGGQRSRGPGFIFDRNGSRVPRRGVLGFTLVEVLVALAIVAIALTAGVEATLALTRNAQRQSDALLAHLCAENELVKVRLLRQMPGIGDTRISCEQGGQNLAVDLKVRPTPNPNFRRVDAQVLRDELPILKLSTVVGQY